MASLADAPASNSSLASDILLAVPRFAVRAGVFAIHYLPEQLDGFFGKVLTPGRFVADPTSLLSASPNLTSIGAFVSKAASLQSPSTSSLAADAAAVAANEAQAASILSMSSLFNLARSLTSFSTYVISRWALTTAIMVFVLSRVHVFASSRTPLRLNFFVRAFLYSLPIALLSTEAFSILRAIRCQTSLEWPALRYEDDAKSFPLDYAADGGVLYRISSYLLSFESDQASCQAVSMAGLSGSQLPRGSLSLLWPLFLSLCASQFVESLASALQGRQPVTENSIFEMSLAFAEAEALVTKPFELSVLAGKTNLDASLPMKMSRVKQVMNVTPEVLLLSFIFALSTVSSNVLAVIDRRKRWRLMNTGIWGITYLAAFMWSLNRLFFGEDDDWSFRFPTVFVVGFIPHLIIIVGTIICGCIYVCALLCTILSPPAGQQQARTFKERVHLAYDNLQANVYLAAGERIRFSWEDEFYSTLLKAGFTLLTVASEAVYLTEGNNIRVSNMTWLEQSRVDDLAKQQGYLYRKTQKSIPSSLKQTFASAHNPLNDKNANAQRPTGYMVERKTRERKPNTDNMDVHESMLSSAERRSLLAFRFLQGIFWLSISIVVLAALAGLRRLGINYRPLWIRKLVDGDDQQPRRVSVENIQNQPLEFWLLKEDGTFHLADDPRVDVEAEMRAQVNRGAMFRDMNAQHADMDSRLYDWWKRGGWWGEADGSGDFVPSEQEDDATSVISSAFSELSDSDAWTDEAEASGQRTPTQRMPFPQSQGQNDLFDASTLATLLDPRTLEQRQEARMLSRRLQSNGIMTRSKYQRAINKDRSNILTTSRAFNMERKLLDADLEEQMLEQFILEQRTKVGSKRKAAMPSSPVEDSASWSTGAPGMGNSGPMCVVCQDSPRTILLWPCGCLSMCDDCRVSMATRNFTSCVCCRTATEAFSRLYVP